MKILLLNNAAFTLVGKDYCVEPKTGGFAKELKELGNDVSFYGQKIEAKDTIHSYNLKENGIKLLGLKRRRNKVLNYILLYIRIIPEIIKSDFIYIYYPTSFKYVPFICNLFRKKYGLYIRGEQGLDDKISHWLYKHAYTIFTVSDYFTNSIKQIVGKDIVHTTRPIIPLNEKDIISGRKYNLKEEINILFLGRVAYDKGVGELLEAIRVLKHKGYSLKLTLVGSGEFMQDTISLVKEYQIKDVVSIEGAIFNAEKIKELYTSADLYVLPTYHEGFPRTLYEAMVFGTPIITTFVGGIPGLMKDGYNCKEIKPKSVQSIVEGLEFAFNNYDKMIEYAKNGFKTVIPIIDSKRMSHAEQLTKIIRTK
jgi:glycosyltransferase involved in cell wall biosynthesis